MTALVLKGLNKRFGALTVTDALDLTLHPGEVHAIIGPNGAGKTTLIGQITGEIAPDSGTIAMFGRDVTGWSVPERARAGLARCFQITQLCPGFTAEENVALAVQARLGHSFRFLKPAHGDPALRDPARAALERVGLLARADAPLDQLAHGEKRQLEIAVALAMQPRLLLLDEPMAGMGPEESAGLVSLLASLRGTLPILLIEHDMDAVFSLADRISVLVAGRIIRTGTAAEVKSDAAVREAYLGDEMPHA